jgi:hypothetical protein
MLNTGKERGLAFLLIWWDIFGNYPSNCGVT